MTVVSRSRSSESPFVETVWHVQAVSDGCDTVAADVSWDMLILRRNGKSRVSVWGPMTKIARIPHKEGDECLGIRFKRGTFVPHFAADKLLVDQGVVLPEATDKTFWFHSSALQLPDYDNVDTFVSWLARRGIIARDPLVDAVLCGCTNDMSLRSIQRRFLRTIGLTPSYVRYIERAQHAFALLKQGVPILDVIHDLDYTDQSHLTKSLRKLIGQTPAQILMSDE